ncbi:MAG: hypothetical protein JXR76_01825 [Deltaproteobacteria bacterium]|nr:hypothetical protein [Deltaproteobacteria bacterium]
MNFKHTDAVRPWTLPFIFSFCFAAFGCGGESPQNTDAASPTPQSTIKTGDGSIAPRTTTKPAAGPKRALFANGVTENGKSVQLNATVQDNNVTGTLQIDGIALQAVGMHDGDTIRCWLKGDGENGVYRGNLVAQLLDSKLNGHFTVSGNAGINVIQGSVSN